jgi:hypothetical protein
MSRKMKRANEERKEPTKIGDPRLRAQLQRYVIELQERDVEEGARFLRFAIARILDNLAKRASLNQSQILTHAASLIRTWATTDTTEFKPKTKAQHAHELDEACRIVEGRLRRLEHPVYVELNATTMTTIESGGEIWTDSTFIGALQKATRGSDED